MRSWPLRHPGPSLARRVITALLLAFALVWVVLIALDYLTIKSSTQDRVALKAATQALAEAIAEADPAHAAAIVRATESQFNRSRRASGLDGIGDLLFSLRASDGTALYESAALAAAAPPVAGGQPNVMPVAGRDHWMASHQAPGWRLTLLEPVLDDQQLLRWLNAEQLLPMAVALPLVLLPLWLAVRRGLRPLSELAGRVAARAPDDISPLGVNPQHAELRPLVQALEQLLARARHSLLRERAFVQDAAHELRTPLAVVAAQAHALVAARDGVERQRAQAALERAVERASHLVHQVLTLARVEAGAARRAQPVDVAELVRQVLIDATPRAAELGIEVALESPDHLPARLDAEALHSIVDNLLRNALAYCPRDSHVLVRLSAQGGQLSLEVLDDGPGIGAADAAAVFDRFRRGHGVQARGAGLGLSIVRQAAQVLGGSVTLGGGIAGRGAGFVVVFSAGPPAELADPADGH